MALTQPFIEPMVVLILTNLSFSVGCLYLLLEIYSSKGKKKKKK